MTSAPLQSSTDTASGAAGKPAAPADGLAPAPAPELAAAQPGAAAPLAFLQFMQVEAPALAEALQRPELATAVPDDALDAAAAAAPAGEVDGEAAPEAGETLLAAMSMPLMPAMMTLPTALPALMRLASAAPEHQERRDAALAPAAAGGADAAEPRPGNPAPVAPLPAPAVEAAGAPRPGAAPQAAPPASAAPAAVPASDAAGAEGQATGNAAGFGIAAPAAAPAAPREGASLSLSGPPTAWRQSLQEALGERLQLQLGKNAEQAVIRLEPPMLGRIEISIRHAAGSLEVNITATHGEVLRQLNGVSENLRSDLAGRAYTDVSVNVSQATPRAQAAAQAGAGLGADAQGRGRQQGQEQDQRAPGAALAEANQSTTAFSLGGRA